MHTRTHAHTHAALVVAAVRRSDRAHPHIPTHFFQQQMHALTMTILNDTTPSLTLFFSSFFDRIVMFGADNTNLRT